MTNWTTIPDSNLDAGKPIRSIDGKALRDNPIAIAEGSTGAPKITNNAFTDNTINGSKLVDSSVSTSKLSDEVVTADSLGDITYPVGSIALCWSSSTSSINYGSTVAGTSLYMLDMSLLFTGGGNNTINSKKSGSLINVGTWKALNNCVYIGSGEIPAGLFVRVS